MNTKHFFSISLLIALNTLSVIALAESSVWKISKGDKYFYLGGTIHLLSPEDYPLPQAFIDAYRDSDKLIFETDIANADTPESQQKFLSAMTSGSDKTLIDKLDNTTYQQLQDFLASRNIPVENFSRFYPWAVALTISVLEYQRLGMLPEYGVEEYFNKLAVSDNKALGALESLEEQISFLQSMEDIEPNIMINYTLRDLKELPDFIKILKNSWRSGDIESFTTNSSIVRAQSEFPGFYYSLVTYRNNQWMLDLVKLNSNKITEFVLVGTLHLNGEEGLLNQLRLVGFDVEQL